MSQTRFGNAVFATGGNAQAARLQGIRIDRVRVTNFVISGFLAALAGIIQVARLKSVDPLRGTGLELEVIAAVVIGGTLLTGGLWQSDRFGYWHGADGYVAHGACSYAGSLQCFSGCYWRDYDRGCCD